MPKLSVVVTILLAILASIGATLIKADEASEAPAVEPPAGKSGFAAPANPLAYESAPASNRQGLDLLTWDDGSFENGLGPTGGHYDGQFAMRFGGAAATTALVPFQIQRVYFQFRAGNPGVTAANVNIWHPLATNGFPANPATPAAQNPAPVATGVPHMVNFTGPTISTANGSVLVGVGGLGTTSWFIDRDTNGPDNNRDFAGSNANNTLPLSFGPTTLGNLGFSGNYFIRLLVDGNVPVELESFSVE